MQPRISPDGTKLAFTRAGKGTADIWVLDFQSGATTQLTTDPGYDENPSWSFDGKALVYGGSVSQGSGLVIATIDGSRPPRVAVGGAFLNEGQFLPKRPSLLVSHPTDRGTQLAIANLDNGNLLRDLTTEAGYEGQASPSPDGQWLADWLFSADSIARDSF